ncbi:MAG: hypothetical protein MI892_19435 [Desulfobacterales bacterium]|nr:hypothetical protein [Desulfobacterales bacterium]
MSQSRGKIRQRRLQIILAVGFILAVILVELVAVAPKQIFSYTQGGIYGFNIGLDRKELLDAVNQVKSIRAIDTCLPSGKIQLSSRKGFEMTPGLETAAYWRCRDRKKGIFLFSFKDDILDRIIHLNKLLAADDPFELFQNCFTDQKAIDDFLTHQQEFPVSYQ